jgi:hypothetical protein
MTGVSSGKKPDRSPKLILEKALFGWISPLFQNSLLRPVRLRG